MKKSLKTLIRLHKNDIDKQVEIINSLNLQLDRFNQASNHLKMQMEKELQSNLQGFSDITASFIQTNLDRQKILASEITKIENILVYEQEILRLLFENKKKYEKIDKNQIDNFHKKNQKKEQDFLDEINTLRRN